MSKIHILQIEDDENDIFLLQHAFQRVGIANQLQVARDGEEAIEYLSGEGKFSDRRRFPLPCLIILDLKMPRKTGLELLDWIRNESNLQHIPVIMLSSSAQPDDIDQAYDLGANAFLVKPASNPERFRMALAIKDFWLEQNHPPPRCIGTHLRRRRGTLAFQRR